MIDNTSNQLRQRAELGLAIGRRAEEVGERTMVLVNPDGLSNRPSDVYLEYRRARTIIGTLLIARWLVTGVGADRGELEWITSSGALAAREGVPLVLTTRGFHYWRDVLIDVAIQEAERLATPAEVLNVAVEVVRRSADASLVRIADAYDTQLRAMNAQLERASQFKSDFLARVSHELRTPLTGIIGFCELLLEGMDAQISHEQTQDVAQIHASGLLMLELVNQILDLSKIEAGQMTMAIEVVDLDKIADQVIGTVSPLVQAKALNVTSEVTPAAKKIMGDSVRIRQVMLNLMSNAIKFTPHGSIAIQAKAVDGMAEISVRDGGIGIAAEAQDRIFEEFRQADDKIGRTYGGTGLGLSISRKLVELQGGRMGVESKVGAGSRFWFTIPLVAAA